MNIGRRGFLHTLAAAAVGMATFDPKSLLWVPAQPAASIELVPDAELYRRASLQLELNDLALRFAELMTDRLERHPSVAMREIMFRHAGHVRLQNVIELETVGRGLFVPAPYRLAKTGECGMDSAAFLRNMAGDMSGELAGVDMFAPMGAELRPGEPFSDDTAVGVATDPQSGLTARALRFTVDRGRRSRTLTMVELAGGRWTSFDELKEGETRGQSRYV